MRTEDRLPEHVEVGAYYVVAEALTNAARHAHATTVTVEVEAAKEVLRVWVRDDGVGGADLARGSGLVGLKDRVEALGGRIAATPAGVAAVHRRGDDRGVRGHPQPYDAFQLRRMLRAQASDLYAEFLALLPERPRPTRIQRWSPAASGSL